MPLAIVLPLPAEVAARVALPSSVPGALPARDLHVTLCVLTAAPPDLVGALARIATATAPVDAVLSGVGRFAGAAGGPDAFHLTVDALALLALREQMQWSFGAVLDRTHGFDPHATLAYLAPDVAAPLARVEPTPVRLDALALWDGDARTTFPLGTAMTDLVTLDAIELPTAPPTELRLFRDGWNDTVKGRFLLDAEGAAEILRRFAAHGVELAMDFDHGTFSEGGSKRDVPGYIGALDDRPGDGLYATGIRWTEVGLRAIAPGRAPDGAPTGPEYRYLSPAIDFDPDTRRVLGLKPVALVSWPATVGQRPLVMSAAHAALPTPETRTMKTVLALLGLADNADESAVLAAVQSTRRERDALLTALDARDLPSALGKITALTTARAELDAAQKRATEALVGLRDAPQSWFRERHEHVNLLRRVWHGDASGLLLRRRQLLHRSLAHPNPFERTVLAAEREAPDGRSVGGRLNTDPPPCGERITSRAGSGGRAVAPRSARRPETRGRSSARRASP